jgi:hypothetical protein
VTTPALESALAKLCANTGEFKPRLLRDEASALLAKIEAADRLEWQPIETAPKDRLIDIWIPHGTDGGVRWADCYYDHICDEWRTSRPSGKLMFIRAHHVSHWRLPPDPPASQPAGECNRCGGPVYNRAGKPGEFDHKCNPQPAGGGE